MAVVLRTSLVQYTVCSTQICHCYYIVDHYYSPFGQLPRNYKDSCKLTKMSMASGYEDVNKLNKINLVNNKWETEICKNGHLFIPFCQNITSLGHKRYKPFQQHQ